MGALLLIDGKPVLIDGAPVIVPTGEDAADCECCGEPGECCVGCPSMANITVEWDAVEVEQECETGTLTLAASFSKCGGCGDSGFFPTAWVFPTEVSASVDTCPGGFTCSANTGGFGGLVPAWRLFCTSDRATGDPLWELWVDGFIHAQNGTVVVTVEVELKLQAARTGTCPPASGWTVTASNATNFSGGGGFCEAGATITDTGTITVSTTVGDCEGDPDPEDCDECGAGWTGVVSDIDVDAAPCFFTDFSSTMICDPNACSWYDDTLGLRSVSGNSEGCCDCDPPNASNGAFSISVFCDGDTWVATAAIFCDHFDDEEFAIGGEPCWPVILEMMWTQAKGEEDCPPETGWGLPVIFSFGNETSIIADTGKATFTMVPPP